MSKHHWTSQKIITVRESIDDTKLTQVVHYITKDKTMPGYDSKKSKFGSRKPRNTDKLSKEEQKKIEERNKKRGLTKAQAQDVGLTGQKSRDAAAQLRADQATQKAAVAKEAKRKAAEKKKMKAVSNASLLAGGIGASVGQKTAQIAAQKAAQKATQKAQKAAQDAAAQKAANKKLKSKILETPNLAKQEPKFIRYGTRRIPGSKNRVPLYKAGGLVKKKSIDGIAKRGKTKLKRVKG